MADKEQWVNLTVDNKWKGEGLTNRAHMSPTATVLVRFKKQKRANFFVTKKADGGNAAYTATEQGKRKQFNQQLFTKRRYRTNDKGTLQFKTDLTLAGGEEYSFEVEDKAGVKKTVGPWKTRRKLYYQIVKMVGAPSPSTAAFEAEFWTPGDKLYIKLVEKAPGKTIKAKANLNDLDVPVFNLIKRRARKQYDKAKKPYSVLTLVALKGIYEIIESETVLGMNFGAGAYPLSTNEVLLDIADPAEDYFRSLFFTESATGNVHNIAKGRCTRVGERQIDIDTAGLPQGAAGDLSYSMRVCGHGLGLSEPTENLTYVASQNYDGSAVPVSVIEAVVNHEMGHKIGMVPGSQGTPALDPQGTYYDGSGHSGGHCHHGTIWTLGIDYQDPTTVLPTPPDCTMFGDVRTGTGVFCPDCKKSIRKLDLRARTNVGIRTQF